MNKIDDTTLSNFLDLTIDLKLEENEYSTGLVYSFCRNRNCIVLLNITNSIDNINMKSYTVSFVNVNKILEIKKSEIQLKLNYSELVKPNLEKIKETERMNVEKDLLLKRADKSNLLYKTYQKGYAIFDRLSKIYKCRFHGSKISFEELDAYIDVPFNLKDLHCDDDYTKGRLTKLIEQCLNSVVENNNAGNK